MMDASDEESDDDKEYFNPNNIRQSMVNVIEEEKIIEKSDLHNLYQSERHNSSEVSHQLIKANKTIKELKYSIEELKLENLRLKRKLARQSEDLGKSNKRKERNFSFKGEN